MTGLQHIQALFMDATFNSDKNNSAADELGNHLHTNNRLTPQQQIDIYRNSIIGSLASALGQIYPVCKKIVGEDFFYSMATEYIKNNLSTSPDLADYGERFAGFIQDFKPAAELVYLADVARLEWAWHIAFHAADHDGMDIRSLAQLSDSVRQTLVFMLPPGSSLIASDYPLDAIWQANQDDNQFDQVINLDQGGVKLLLWRQHYSMHTDRLTENEWLLLSEISKPQSFTNICSKLADRPQLNIPRLLPLCVQRGWIADFSLGVIK